MKKFYDLQQGKKKLFMFHNQMYVYRYNDICLILHYITMLEILPKKNYSAIILRLSAA